MPGADERPVMQDFKDDSQKRRVTDMSQFPGDKAGNCELT